MDQPHTTLTKRERARVVVVLGVGRTSFDGRISVIWGGSGLRETTVVLGDACLI